MYVMVTLTPATNRTSLRECVNVNTIPAEIAVICAVNHSYRRNGEKLLPTTPTSVNVSNITVLSNRSLYETRVFFAFMFCC